MRKSLFSKLMLTYFAILVISYFVVSIFLSVWFYKYYYNKREQALISQRANINKIVQSYIYGTDDADKLNFELSVISRLLNAKILVIDNYNYLLGTSEDELRSQIGYAKQMTGENLEVALNQLKKGKIYVSTGSAKQKLFSTPQIMVGIPVMLNDQVQCSVVLYSRIDEIKSTLSTVFTAIWVSAFFVTIISAFILYYLSNRILIRPLGRINNTAKSIAKGDFDKRITVISNDEIGDLAVSFNYMADSVQNLENMRKSFITNISHELRSPMTSINGFITGMLDDTIPMEKWQHYLGIVHDETKRLMRLINDLLDLARMESGEFSMNITTFDFNQLIRNRVVNFEDKLNKKNVHMDVKIVGNKLKVKGDPDRIDQVVTNLLDNAIKFVPESGVIQIKNCIKDGKVIVSIANNGPGIPKEEIKYIWDRFHKVDKVRSKGGGTGLGLSITRQIINQHNETIWVESGEEGTKFLFTLTLASH